MLTSVAHRVEYNTKQIAENAQIINEIITIPYPFANHNQQLVIDVPLRFLFYIERNQRSQVVMYKKKQCRNESNKMRYECFP